MKNAFISILMLAAVSGLACKKEPSSTSTGVTTTVVTTTPAPTATPAPVYPVVLGVPECDSYIYKIRTCLESKVPDIAQIPLKIALEKGIAEWKKTAAFPEKRPELAPACQLAEQASKQAMTKFQCQW